MLGRVLAAARQAVAPVVDVLRATTSLSPGRRVWHRDGLCYLEVRGLHRPGTEAIAQELADRLTSLEGVHHATVNPALGRVVIRFDPDVVDVSAFHPLINDLEAQHDLTGIPRASVNHPGNAEVLLQDFTALAAEFFGVGFAALSAVLPVRTAPSAVVSSLSLLDSVPRFRARLERRLGPSATETVLTLGNSLVHSVSGNPVSAISQTASRFVKYRETAARHRSWAHWADSSDHGTSFEVRSRPRPLRPGPVERTADALGMLALAGSGAALALTRNPQRASAVLSAGVPRAAKSGREGFAAQLSTTVATRGGLVLMPEAVRRLDRVDAVVFDAPVLLTGRKMIDAVVPLDPAPDDSASYYARASEVIDPQRPRRSRHRDGWSARPVTGGVQRFPAHVRAAFEEHRSRGADLWWLLHDDRPVALVSIIAELAPLAEELVAAARPVGTVAIADVDHHLAQRLAVDRVLPAGEQLADSVRQLQREGATVVVVSSGTAAALAAADVGIGLCTKDNPTWAADLLCPTPALVHLLLRATEEARKASRYAAAAAVAGACLSAVVALLGPARGASSRVSVASSGTSLFSLATGVWLALRAGNRAPPVPQDRIPWHTMPVAAVLSTLATSERGLPAAQARARETDADSGPTGLGFAGTVLQSLANPMTPVLGVGAVLSAALGSPLDALFIGAVLGISALVEAAQRVSADRELKQLLATNQVLARRRRGRKTELVPAEDLLVGDVIELRAGDWVPADCRLLEVDGLETDESTLTGESLPVVKDTAATTAATTADRRCMLYQGTSVASGSGTAVVVATGENTELGRSSAGAAPAVEPNGVEARLARLTTRVLPLSAGAGVVLFGMDLLRRVPLAQAVARSIGLSVAAVPEGLPFVATLAELAAARRLAARGVLVRSPRTIEALGRVDVLCFDKTGTLTQGKIALGAVSNGVAERPVRSPESWVGDVLAAAVRATPRPDGQPLPHPTDQAVLSGAAEAGVPTAAHPVSAELPFEPSRGFHAVHSGGLLSVKGAPEVVLDRCSGWRHPDGLRDFDATGREQVEAGVEDLALRGFRVLAIAERRVPEDFTLDEGSVAELELVGLIALADPVHPAAAEAVTALERSGVEVVMITGDHPTTAEAIATELGILGDRRVLSGAELEALDDAELREVLPKAAVFARVSPAQKARIVRLLQETGRTVAMAGDGANDVPAIGLADVGIAFGSRATSAARQAADLVVSDDRIETLTRGIIEGRGMWVSVRDALSLLLGGNLGEIGYALATGLLGGGALNARQLLVVNMLTDVLPAIAIAVRPPVHVTPEQLLAEGPEASLGEALARDTCLRAAVTAGAAGLAWLAARVVGTPGQARTTGLVALVAAQLAQTLAARYRSSTVLAASLGSLLLLAALVQIPGLSHFFGNRPLWPQHWGIALTAALAAAVVVLLWQKWSTVKRSPRLFSPS